MVLHHRRRLAAARDSGLGPGHIACLPGRTHPRAMVLAIAAELGLEVRSDPEGALAVIFWQEDPKSPFHEPPEDLASLNRKRPVVNIRATDLSKTTVARRSGEVFGHPLLLDPAGHVGAAVEKPEGNGLRQARIVDCPTDPVPGFCYQRLVDNRLDAEWTEDLRPVVIGGRVVCLIRKVRPIEGRFGNPVGGPTRPELHEATDYLSGDEIAKVLTLAESLGADYCEIDCLRDRDSGLLYAVDLNTTPAFFDRYLPETRERLVTLQARAFERSILQAVPT